MRLFFLHLIFFEIVLLIKIYRLACSFLKICIYVYACFVCMYGCAPHVYLVPMEARRGSWNFTWLWDAMWVLALNPGPLNYWALSLFFFIFYCFGMPWRHVDWSLVQTTHQLWWIYPSPFFGVCVYTYVLVHVCAGTKLYVGKCGHMYMCLWRSKNLKCRFSETIYLFYEMESLSGA